MDILILGGNQFFGKKLTKILIDEGHKVTLLNRGNVDDGFGDQISRIKCDRNDKELLIRTLGSKVWDIVYDQICFDYDTAKDACEVFEGKAKKFIFTSSNAVYQAGENLVESDFRPEDHTFEKKETMMSDYGEAKRQAEAAFHMYAKFPVTYVRFPVVVGNDDYTGRFQFHVESIKNKVPIYFPNINVESSFITSDFAAKTLAALGKSSFSGPINAASPSPITMQKFISIIEEAVGEKLRPANAPTPECHSPYGRKDNWFLDCSKLKELGLVASEISEWLPLLLKSS
ncbi:hypothetical protein A9Q84_15070 [Halobacteriovorax marinus]|uniref:UDP-glucose 4-epimerase n=1 Tax=Halobacteriovorax marinus TaxID=97084 RepID=A0A1Y5F580_9BACT|nr:hypothetical protein A9Q84_15070 [Halobacteriovorax marinus]